MANAMILKEYMVALGLQDQMTPQLQRTLRQSQRSIRQFSAGIGKVSIIMGGLLMAANAGIARFMTGLVNTDDRVRNLAEETGKAHDEATRLDFALRTMGRSLEEIEASPELSRQFQQLQRDAEQIQIPDMSEGLNQVRAIQGEFLRLRNAASHGIQWIGHHLLKYLYHPMNQLREVFSGLNDRIIGGMPEWSRRIAGVMASVVRITAAIIRGAAAIFRAIRNIFDMIPTEVRVVMGILAGLAAFIRAGPLGRLMMIFTVLMLLVEDFFTYLDGGEALLGGLWRMLIDLWGTINEGGRFVEALKNAFTAAMDAAVRAIRWVIDWVARLFGRLRDIGAIENFRNAFTRVGRAIGDVFRAVGDIFRVLFGGFRDGAETLQPFLAWLIGVALPGVIGLVADAVSWIANLVSRFMEMRYAREILIGIAAAIGAVIAGLRIYHAVMLVVNKAKAAWAAIIQTIKIAKAVWAGQTAALVGLKGGWLALVKVLTVVKTAWAAVMKIAAVAKAILLSPITLIIAAVAALIALVVLVIRNWERIGEFFRSLWERIRRIFSGIADWFRSLFQRAADAVRAVFEPIINFFRGIWDGIVAIFRAVGNWFRDRFNEAVERIRAVFSAIIGFFRGIWNGIVGIFSAVGGWFRDRFQAAVDGIRAVFSVIGDFFRGIWDGIVAIFSGVVDFFSNIFRGAVDGIRNAFSGLRDFFSNLFQAIANIVKAPINAIIRGINAFIGGLNRIQIPDWVPGVGGRGINIPKLPELAKGGVLRKGQTGYLEGTGAEAVVPLEKNTQWVQKVAALFRKEKDTAFGEGGFDNNLLKNIAENVSSLVGLFSQAASAIAAMDVGLTQQAQTVSNHSTSTTYNYNTFDMTSSYNIKDTSGRPESVATAIDRKEQLKIRNLQGILNTY